MTSRLGALVTDPQSHRAFLEQRNAELREQIDRMLDDLRSRTAQLKEAQSRAVAATGEATSPDGLVRATVDAAGVLTGLEFAPSVFSRSTPEKLARLVTETVQQAARQARQRMQDELEPLQQGASLDLSTLLPGMPSLRDLVPQVPEPPSGTTDTGRGGTTARNYPSVEDDEYDDSSPLDWGGRR